MFMRVPSVFLLCISALVLTVTSQAASNNITMLYVSPEGEDAGNPTCSQSSPCQSLMHAIEDIANYMVPMTDIVQVIMLPGTYGLTSCGVISLRSIAIIGSGISDVSNTTIDCNSRSPGLEITGSTTILSSFVLVNCINDGDGGAVYASLPENSSLAIDNMLFENNLALSPVSNEYAGNGGAIGVNVNVGYNISVVIQDSVFVGNAANLSGGAVSIIMYSPNSVSMSAVGNYAYENTAYNAYTILSGGGGWLAVDLMPVQQSDVVYDCDVVLANNVVESCIAHGNGTEGMRYIEVSMTNSTYSDCLSISGGAVYVELESFQTPTAVDAFIDVTVDACTFDGNQAYSRGGALMLNLGGENKATEYFNLTLSGTAFTNNTSPQYSGADIVIGSSASVFNGDVVIEGCTFQSNSGTGALAYEKDSALYVQVSGGVDTTFTDSVRVRLSESTFSENIGGGFQLLVSPTGKGVSNIDVTLDKITATANVNGVGGGVIIVGEYVHGAANVSCMLLSSEFSYNQGPGVNVILGGVYTFNTSAFVSDVNASYNINNGNTSNYFTAGGVVAQIVGVVTNASIEMENSAIIGNSFMDNDSGPGLVVYVLMPGQSNLVSVTFVNVTLAKNVAAYSVFGSGLQVNLGSNSSVITDAKLLLRGCIIQENTGGAAMIQLHGVFDGLSVQIQDSNVTGNRPSGPGSFNSGSASLGLLVYGGKSSHATSHRGISIQFLGCYFLNNIGRIGGAGLLLVTLPAVTERILLEVTGSVFASNSFDVSNGLAGEGAGMFLAFNSPFEASVASCMFVNNSATSNSAISLSGLPDPPLNAVPYCANANVPTLFRQWDMQSSVLITDSEFIDNTASCEGVCSASGGAVGIKYGGNLTIQRSIFSSNAASTFGGALSLGGSSLGVATCQVTITNTSFSGNIANKGGSTIYNTCNGNMSFSATTVSMSAMVSEVTMPITGAVSFNNSRFECPPANNFMDAFGGLYGTRAFASDFAFPWNVSVSNSISPCPFKASSLQFGCVPCQSGQYAVSSGWSDGTSTHNVVCHTCPFGGACNGDGTVVAQPGFWGAVTDADAVSFGVCPGGYCCDSNCTAMQQCAGNRTGPLCGDCKPQFVEAMFSTACTPRSGCATGMIKFWLLFVLFVLVDAFVQLAFVSNMLPGAKQAVISAAQGIGAAIWRAVSSCAARVCRCSSSTFENSEAEPGTVSRLIVWIRALFVRARRSCRREQPQHANAAAVDTSPDIRIKCLVYFFQMSQFVSLQFRQSTIDEAMGILTSILRQQPHSGPTTCGIACTCVSTTLTATSKIGLNAAIPFMVGVAMLLIMVAVYWLPVLWRRITKRQVRSDFHTGAESDAAELTNLTERLLHEVHSESTTVSMPLVAHNNIASSFRQTVIVTMLNFGVTMYSTFVGVVVAMLQCVRLPGSSRSVLFLYGSRACDYAGWQAGYILLLIVLVAVPFVVAWASRWAHQGHSDNNSASAIASSADVCSSCGAVWELGSRFCGECGHRRPAAPISGSTSAGSSSLISESSLALRACARLPLVDIRASIHETFVAPYSDTYSWWEAVLILHRLLLAMLFTFGSAAAAVQCSLSVLLCFAACCLHVYAQPMKRRECQSLQTWLLSCLAIVAVSRMLQASVLQVASPNNSASGDDFFEGLTLTFGYFVPLLLFVLSIASS